MKCRIMIEDENGLYQAELEKDKNTLDIINNLRIILDMKKIETFIHIAGYETENGCHISVRGNAETIAKQYDALTQFMIKNNPEIIQRVICAWAVRTKNE